MEIERIERKKERVEKPAPKEDIMKWFAKYQMLLPDPYHKGEYKLMISNSQGGMDLALKFLGVEIRYDARSKQVVVRGDIGIEKDTPGVLLGMGGWTTFDDPLAARLRARIKEKCLIIDGKQDEVQGLLQEIEEW